MKMTNEKTRSACTLRGNRSPLSGPKKWPRINNNQRCRNLFAKWQTRERSKNDIHIRKNMDSLLFSCARILRLELLVADAELIASVTHQAPQFLDAQIRHFLHANQQ